MKNLLFQASMLAFATMVAYQFYLFLRAVWRRDGSYKTSDEVLGEFNFCQNCQQICAIEDLKCCNCGENICLFCGCTDSVGCHQGCYWSRPGVCSKCE